MNKSLYQNKSACTQKGSQLACGFTLVEIIVSLGIFAVVATVALGALVKIVSANRKAQTVQSAVTNINFALDAMSREMRVGRNYFCHLGSSFAESTLTQDYTESTKCPSGYTDIDDGGSGRVVAFNSSRVDRITNPGNPCSLITAYAFIPNGNGTFTLSKAEQQSCGSSSYTFDSIIDPAVTITGYYVRVVASLINPYPHAVIRLSGYSGVLEKDKTYFDVQTAVSARIR